MSVASSCYPALASLRAFFEDSENERRYQEWLETEEGRAIAAKLTRAPETVTSVTAKS